MKFNKWRLILCLACALPGIAAFSQARETVPVGTIPSWLSPGVYQTFEDFMSNNPIPPQMIESGEDPSSPYFYASMFSNRGKIKVRHDGGIAELGPASIWGYFDGRNIFVSKFALDGSVPFRLKRGHPFIPIIMFGSFCLLQDVKVVTSPAPGQTPAGNMYSATTVPFDHILDTRDGKVYELTKKTFVKLIADDPGLLEEFKDNRESIDLKLLLFVRKYNERHPFSRR